ncbi:MAG: ATP phosphoribosyltransferase regulatory subunit, partial [Lachnospiraceae bacterium]|nr:ATP phosphoribosyltransferase regulatory subunit [Lachnospiraceae bacterium]
QKVYHALSFYHAESHIGFDLSMLSDYKYYTGIIFKGYTYGTGDAIVRGGRYNALLSQFGKDAPAIGFVFVVDELMNAIHRQNIFIPIEEEEIILLYPRADQQRAIEYGVELRKQGKKVELTRMSEKKTLEDYKEYAKKEHLETIIYMHDGTSETYAIKW